MPARETARAISRATALRAPIPRETSAARRLPCRAAMKRSAILLSLLAACGDSSPGGPGGAIPFHGEAQLLSGFEWDSGYLPEGSAAQIRVNVHGGGGVTVDARGNASGDSLAPVAGSGRLSAEGSVMLEVHAKVDVATIHYEGVVQEVGYTIPVAESGFEPFLIGSTASLESTLPAEEILRAPIPSVPGSTFILSVTGGMVTTTFGGTCASARGGYAQYLGRATITGTLMLAGTIEIEVPFAGTQTFGPFDVEVPIPAIERDVDLGLFQIASGMRVESGPSPCMGGGDGGVVRGDGSVRRDGGVSGDGGFVRLDGSAIGDGGLRLCAVPRDPPATGELCDNDTLVCLMAATTSEEADACFAGDGAPVACRACIEDELFSCMNRECAAEFQTYACCAVDRGCTDLEGDRFVSCVEAFCIDQFNAYGDCGRASPCGTTNFCFRAP